MQMLEDLVSFFGGGHETNAAKINTKSKLYLASLIPYNSSAFVDVCDMIMYNRVSSCFGRMKERGEIKGGL